jgi:hypothetical protein
MNWTPGGRIGRKRYNRDCTGREVVQGCRLPISAGYTSSVRKFLRFCLTAARRSLVSRSLRFNAAGRGECCLRSFSLAAFRCAR